MFERSSTDKRRVVIIDVSHLFYKYAFGGATSLSTTIRVDGVPTVIDTTLPSYTIKQIHRWSLGGYNPTVVCFDGAGSTKSRKAYWIANKLRDEDKGYKEGREVQDRRFYDGINITKNLLIQGGVCVLQAEGYEADDLIKAAIDKAKVEYPNLPIDVITGDVDLVPLVDEQVSVFLTSKKVTWAEEPAIEKRHYIQITPNNYQDYIEGLTEFKGLLMPYNTVLLKKVLRGDKSDQVAGYPKFTPTKYNKLIMQLAEDGIRFDDFCRYDAPTETICYRGTEEPIPLDKIDEVPREQKMIKYGEPPALTRMIEILRPYLNDENFIHHIRVTYNGININGAFTGLPDGFNRRPARISAEIKGYNEFILQQAVSYVQINLPKV